jgi:hypothetical protein
MEGLRQHRAAKHPRSRVAKSGRRRVRWITIAGVALVLIIGFGFLANYGLNSQQAGKFGKFPFPCTGSTPLVIHIHPYLQIFINNQSVTIPADIGLTSTCTEPMHTHDSSGIIHVESPTNTTYTLGDFFQIWKDTYGTVQFNGTQHPVVFNSTDILGYKADSSHQLLLLVDGVPSSQYGSLVLNTLDYCDANNSVSPNSPCYATAQGAPYWFGENYPYGTGHTIEILYETISG